MDIVDIERRVLAEFLKEPERIANTDLGADDFGQQDFRFAFEVWQHTWLEHKSLERLLWWPQFAAGLHRRSNSHGDPEVFAENFLVDLTWKEEGESDLDADGFDAFLTVLHRAADSRDVDAAVLPHLTNGCSPVEKKKRILFDLNRVDFRLTEKEETECDFVGDPDMEKDTLPIAWWLSDLLHPGFVLLTGKPKTGKTWLAASLMYAVAHEEEIFGRYARKGKVGIVELDMSYDQLKEYFSMLRAGLDFRSHSFPLIHDRLDISQSEGQERLIRFIENQELDVLILDSLRKVHTINENYSEEVNKVLGGFLIPEIVKKRRVTVLAIAHTAKHMEGSTRGSGEWEAAADSIMVLSRTNQNGRRLKITGRHPDLEIDYVMKCSESTMGLYRIANQVEDLREEILTLLDKEPLTVRQIKNLVPGRAKRIEDTVNELLDRGLITRNSGVYFKR